MRPRIWHWIWSLSLGGDAKNLCALVSEQTNWADVKVLTRSADPGERAKDLAMLGVEVFGAVDNQSKIAELLVGGSPSLVIMHRNGRSDDVETKILESLKLAAIPCFEFNTFGRVDTSTDDLFEGHLFPSRSCLLQYAQRRGESHESLSGLSAPGYAVEVPEPITELEKDAARRSLGLADDCFVVARLGRPDLRKWHPLPVLAIRRLQRSRQKVHLIVRSVPPQRKHWITNMLGDAVTLLDQTSDPREIRQTLAASDCLVNYSHIGETFGLALAEGMVCGLPVIVNSTPSMDNAQIELCNHGVTGLVANTVTELAEAISLLVEDPALAAKLGSAARSFISETFMSDAAEQRSRRFIIERLKARASATASQIPPPSNDIHQYEINEEWLLELKQREADSQQDNSWQSQQLIDRAYLRWLGLTDSVDYVSSMGFRDLVKAVAHRVSRRSLARK